MTFDLEFDQRALKEWHKLADTVRQQFKSKSQGARPLEVGQPIKGNDSSKAL